MVSDYLDLNLANWDERAPAHAASPDYALDRFRADPGFLSGVVRFDRERLGDLTGLRGVHLQCHLGTDTLSLSRLGARMSGLDFSGAALALARGLAAETGAEIDYHHSDVHAALDVLDVGGYDLVYTGVGALCWLPSVERWAGVLRPGGRLFLRETHPMLWALDETQDPPTVAHPYFERAEPVVFDEQGTYVATDIEFTNTRSASWNHGLGETVTALADHGLRLTTLVEHDSVPYEAIPGQMDLDAETGEWRLREQPDRLAASYTLIAVKN